MGSTQTSRTLRQSEFTDRLPGAAEVRQLHLGIFPRKQHAVGAPSESCLHSRLRLLRCAACCCSTPWGYRCRCPARSGLRARRTLHRPSRFAIHVIGRKSGERDLLVAALAEVHHPIVEVERVLLRQICEQGAGHAIYIGCHAFAAAVVIHHHLQEVGVLRAVPASPARHGRKG